MEYLFMDGWVCPICGREYDKKPPVRCSTCGHYTEPKHLREYWDQTDPRYTDEKLQDFARKATRFLLEPDYRKAKMIYNVRVEIREMEGRNWGYLGYNDPSNYTKGQAIYYRLPTLRHKKQCAHNVAHECAHASPECWYIRTNDLAFHEQTGGHHATQYKKLWEYKSKLRSQYPEYCSD